MKKVFKVLLSVFILANIAFGLTGCGVKPDPTAKGFLDELKKQDIAAANKYIKDVAGNGKVKFATPSDEKWGKAVFSKLEYEIKSSSTQGKNAVVKIKVIVPDVEKIMPKLGKELRDEITAQVQAGNTNFDKKKIEEMFVEKAIKAINDPKAPKLTSNVDMKLIKEEKEWKVQPTNELIDALTGNAEKAATKLKNMKM